MVVAQNTSLLDKLSKIQRLADRAGTPEEAAAAAAKLQELLFKHNLEMADVLMAASLEDDKPSTASIEQGFHDLKYRDSWRRNLFFAIASNNFCKAVFYRGSSRMSVIGQKHNIEAVQMMYDYLCAETIRLGHEAWKTTGQYCSHVGASAWRGAFFAGVVETIETRLLQHKLEMQKVDEQSNALVVISDKALAEATKEYFPRLKTMSVGRGNNASYDARVAGRIAGQSISFNKQLKG